MLAAIAAAQRVLALGIGGGGDVVGSLVVAELARAVGTPAIVGGLTWERRPIDPEPGPRRLDEIAGAEVLNEAVALAGPDTVTRAGGIAFAESHMAATSASRCCCWTPAKAPPRSRRRWRMPLRSSAATSSC
ncbi:MAG: DUF1152 domain-containing protein [Actinobacteria bacterium]|nr:DUF1152 domain-containing protein [Actinomycetota bacterium]